MSEATQKVRDFLTKSPSVVYPDDVLGLFEQVELENFKLREFATLAWQVLKLNEPTFVWKGMVDDARKLGIESKERGNGSHQA